MTEAQIFINEYAHKPIGHSAEMNTLLSIAKLKCASFTTFTNENGAGFRFVFRDESVMIADAFGVREGS